MPTEQATRLLARIDDERHAVDHANAKVRADERFAALDAFAYGHAVYLWTPAAGRVRCTTLAGFEAIHRGGTSHPDATPEHLDQVQTHSLRYLSEPAFRAQVHAAARRDHPANLPIKCAKCVRENASRVLPPRRDDRRPR